MTKPYAVIAITKHGVAIARRILHGFRQVDVYYPVKFIHGDEQKLGIHVFEGSVLQYMPNIFQSYQGVIGIVSLGAMVRMIAPLLKDKKTDPAVVVIDDRAKHVISVLSGHLGGANQLATQIASFLKANPVITTASDVGETLAVDLFGREFGWEMDSFEKVTQVSAAVVNEQRVHIVQEAGERHWWNFQKPLPGHFRLFDTSEAAMQDPFDAALVITPRLLTQLEQEKLLANGVLYRPKVIVIGIGCNKGTPDTELEQVIQNTLQQTGVSIKSVRNLATIDLKKDEPGLLTVCERYNWELQTFTARQLNTIQIPNPSETVYNYVGAYGVSEPAARLSSGASKWLVEKVKSGNVTISICLVDHKEQN